MSLSGRRLGPCLLVPRDRWGSSSKRCSLDFGLLARATISDRGTHFQGYFDQVFQWLGVTNRLTTAYHPQGSDKAEVTNWQLKSILEKMVSQTRKERSTKLDDALWAYRTSYKTPRGDPSFFQLYPLFRSSS
ncbi:hypothetical protein LINPERHAP1_LOCUS8756 [Linum perenne]